SLLADEIEHFFLNEEEGLNGFAQGDALMKAAFADAFIFMGNLLFIGLSEPIAEVFQDVLASFAQFRLGQLTQTSEVGVSVNVAQKPIRDLPLVDFDQTNELSGEHTAILRYHGSPVSVICQWLFSYIYQGSRGSPDNQSWCGRNN